MKVNNINKRLCNLRAVLVSGNANNGANAGLAYSNTNNAASNANANIGSRLSSELMLIANPGSCQKTTPIYKGLVALSNVPYN